MGRFYSSLLLTVCVSFVCGVENFSGIISPSAHRTLGDARQWGERQELYAPEVYQTKDEFTMKKLLALLIIGGLLTLTTGCPPATPTSGPKSAPPAPPKPPEMGKKDTGAKPEDKGGKTEDKGGKTEEKGGKKEEKNKKPKDKGDKSDKKDDKGGKKDDKGGK